jgi:hypothetical protein
VVADCPQDGGAALEREYHPRVPPDAELKVISPQSPDPKAAMQVRLAELTAQLLQGLGNLILALGGQTPGFRPETGSNLNR